MFTISIMKYSLYIKFVHPLFLIDYKIFKFILIVLLIFDDTFTNRQFMFSGEFQRFEKSLIQ